MQTKQQISQLLASEGVSPNKQLGQHFLIDLNLMRLLLDTAAITPDDVVLEVGCGTGSLTEALAQRAAAVIAVELDKTLAKIAKTTLARAQNVEILNIDALQSKNTIAPAVIEAIRTAAEKCSGRLLLVANLPYNIASPLMLNLITGPIVADAMYVTVQKEVADRMIARPATPDYGILSVFLGATGDPAVIRTLKPVVFWPPPQVDSAIVGFVRSTAKASKIGDIRIFSDVLSLLLGHRRKMLKAAARLAAGRLENIKNWPEIFENCRIDPTIRPQQLAPDQYVALTNACAAALAGP